MTAFPRMMDLARCLLGFRGSTDSVAVLSSKLVDIRVSGCYDLLSFLARLFLSARFAPVHDIGKQSRLQILHPRDLQRST